MGRLELTWTNKALRLLADADGGYQWVPPSDYRVSEVRLLRDAGTVGNTRGEAERANDNLLITGDALNALKSLASLPEFAREYAGKVRLAYLDPPFNTRQSFLHYDDNLEHSVWLTMMRDRLIQIRELLAPNGSVWVHCDDAEQHRLRCVLDEVFGPACFVSTVVWQKRYSRSNDASFSVSHDYLHIYAPNPGAWAQRRNRLLRNEEQERQYRNPDKDPEGPWRTIPWDAPNIRGPNLSYPITSPSGIVKFPPSGRHWSRTEDQWLELVAKGRAYFGRDGSGSPSFKRYLWEAPEIVPNTWWSHDDTGHNDEAQKEQMGLFPGIATFGTAKPERLLDRIVHIATKPGEIVLDCFLGSATSAAVAHKKGRRWVGIEREPATVETYASPRLGHVVDGTDRGGITEEAGWSGGGGFRLLTVAPSMFAEDGGIVFLSPWATNGKLAEATAAQLGFDYQNDPPLCGRRGRSRLAVIDGLVNEDVARLLATVMDGEETLTICGTAVDPRARDLLRQLRPGSSVRKIPHSILQEYRQASAFSDWGPSPGKAGPAEATPVTESPR